MENDEQDRLRREAIVDALLEEMQNGGNGKGMSLYACAWVLLAFNYAAVAIVCICRFCR